MTRLATYAPFRRAGGLMGQLLGVVVEEPTSRRITERAGGAALTASERERARLEATAPSPPQGPDKLLMSTDGAFVPMVGGGWCEVKTLAIGELGDPVITKGERVIPCKKLSYFSRMMNIDEFILAAYPEIFRRGVETAGQVSAVGDGAEWCQKFIDFHRPDALRILDFPHAAERIGSMGQLCFEQEDRRNFWLAEQLHLLKHDGPTAILDALAELAERSSNATQFAEDLEYLNKRRDQMAYPQYVEAGWPIGSGSVESANKLVVEARLKGPGMHWAPINVNPMLALRNGECNERWDETWLDCCTELRRRPRRRRKRKVVGPVLLKQETERIPCEVKPEPKLEPKPEPKPEPTPGHLQMLGKPKPNHPWRTHNPGYFSRRTAGGAIR